MKKLKLLILVSLTLLFLSSTCKQTTDCCDEAKFFEQSLSAANRSLDELKLDFKELNIKYDSLNEANKYTNESWSLLVGMYDSLLKQPPDTFWFIPQCRLFYKELDTINGIPLYLGYDDIHYRLMQDSATMYNIKINWIDTTIVRYAFNDSTIHLDSLTTGFAGERILWASTLCDKYAKDTCETRLVLGHVLSGSRKETVEICYMTIDAMMFNCGTVDYPTVKLTINNDEGFVIDHDGKRYFQRLLYGFVDVNSITLQPILNEGEQMLFRSIELNSFKLNQPEGWNISVEDGVEYLGNTYFLMNQNSTIKFEKQ